MINNELLIKDNWNKLDYSHFIDNLIFHKNKPYHRNLYLDLLMVLAFLLFVIHHKHTHIYMNYIE